MGLWFLCFVQSPCKDLEESSHSSVEETGAVGMNKQGKTDPLECGRYEKCRDCRGKGNNPKFGVSS